MHLIDSVKDLRKAAMRIKSGCSEDTLFMAKASLLSCEMLERHFRQFDQLAERLLKQLERSSRNGHRIRAKRKPSAWVNFMVPRIRAGKPMQEIAKEWRSQRAR